MNTWRGQSARQDGLFQHFLAAHDPDLAIVDLDAIDEGTQVGLAEGDLSGGEFLTHGFCEALDHNRADVHCPTSAPVRQI